MLLQRLVEFSHRPEMGDLPPVMYGAQPVRYWIELDPDGTFKSMVTVEAEDRSKTKLVQLPTLVRSSGVKAKLLADNGEYVLGRGRGDAKPDAVKRRHMAFVDLVKECAETTQDDDVAAVLAFLTRHDDNVDVPGDFDPTGLIAFRVDGRNPTDSSAARSFWASYATEGKRMECLVCGETRPAMERLQAKLKGIPGGQTAGLALISGNAEAFESYGLTASYVAATCQECSDRFMKAANHLLRADDTHLRLGNGVHIFWTREEIPFSFATILAKPEPDQVRSLLHGVFGGRPSHLDDTPFYAALFTASGARAVVRDWIDTTVGRARQNLGRFFTLQRVTDAWGSEARPLGIYGLANALTRTGSRDSPPPWVFPAMMHVALAGGSLPWTVLYKAVERVRVEGDVSHARASLIKMVLASANRDDARGEEWMIKLDETNRDAAYLCGRLFAELEAVQRAALGEVGAGIVDRYYGTASSAPATVFGQLVRGAQPHLGKLRRDRHAAYVALDRRLQDILHGLTSFPPTLNLKEQAVFALGYYHQRAEDRRSMQARREQQSTVSADEERSEDQVEEE